MGSYISRIAIIPQDPRDREMLKRIDRKTQVDIEQRFGCIVDREWHCNTIATVLIETLVEALGTDLAASMRATKAKIDFYDLFSVNVSIKTNNKAEKEGNINVFFEAGTIAKELIENYRTDKQMEYESTDRALFFSHDDESMSDDEMRAFNGAYLAIDNKATYNLSNNYGITIPPSQKFYTFAITYQFIENLMLELLRLMAENPETDLQSINFNDEIEFHLIRKDDEMEFAMRPGLNAKLLIKSDSTTEHEYSGDDDDENDDAYFNDVPWRR